MKSLSVLLASCFAVLIFASPLLAADPQPLFKADETRPADAIVLFDGKDLSGWTIRDPHQPAKWKVENGYMEVVPGTGDIMSKQTYGDCQIHIEFRLPLMADAKGQARANSGVFLQGQYEVQVLDSYGLNSQNNDCGAIYGCAAPLVNACRPPEQWQSYDVIFRAPTFDADGKPVTKARATVFQNGVLIHDNYEMPGLSPAAISPNPRATGPLVLQDHGNLIRFRNIWMRELKGK